MNTLSMPKGTDASYPETQYFMLDTKGGGKHGDIDFVQYPNGHVLGKSGE
jgi:hypothetical protein